MTGQRNCDAVELKADIDRAGVAGYEERGTGTAPQAWIWDS